MGLLDDLKKRKKIKEMLEEIESEVDNLESIDDVKKFLAKLVNNLKELV